MEPKAIYFRVGLVILAGLAMLTGLVVWVGADSFRTSGHPFETYFSESVQGLDVGATLRFRGVPVGRVTQVAMAAAEYPGATPDTLPRDNAFTLVVVRFEVFGDRLATSEPGVMEKMVEGGLRVRMASQGITGVLYLEADFLDPHRFPPMQVPWQPRYPVIPSAPSTLSQFTSAAERVMEKLEKADLAGLVENTNALISTLASSFTKGDGYRLLAEAGDLLAQLRTSTATIAPDVAAALADARSALEALKNILESREARMTTGGIAAASARLPQTAAAIEGAARRLDSTLAEADRDMGPILRDLRQTVENLRVITENMRQFPSQVLFGAPPPRLPPATPPAAAQGGMR